MIQLLFYSGIGVLQYGLQHLSVIIILTIEIITAVLGVAFGLLMNTNRKGYLYLSIPGFIGCLLFVLIKIMGTRFSDAYIWMPLLAEDLILFAVISSIVLHIKRRFKKQST